jgi:hypothetical protein
MHTAIFILYAICIFGYLKIVMYLWCSKDYQVTKDGVKSRKNYTPTIKIVHLVLSIAPFILIGYYGSAVIEGIFRP